VKTATSSTAGRRLLKEDTYDRLKEMILDGDLAPGTFLSERQISRELGVSASPVRSALERLGLEGFITTSPQRGSLVREMSFRDVADLFEFRTAIETHTVRSLAGRLSADQVTELKAQLADQRKESQRKRPDIPRNVTLDMEFHIMLCRFHGNRQFVRSLTQVGDQIRQVILHVFGTRVERLVSNLEEHAAIAHAVINGHGDKATTLMKTHLRYGKEFILLGDTNS
jgi:DNA-binding GntR family transcriptional regulator